MIGWVAFPLSEYVFFAGKRGQKGKGKPETQQTQSRGKKGRDFLAFVRIGLGPLPNGLHYSLVWSSKEVASIFSFQSFFLVGLGDQRQKGAPERLLAWFLNEIRSLYARSQHSGWSFLVDFKFQLHEFWELLLGLLLGECKKIHICTKWFVKKGFILAVYNWNDRHFWRMHE